MGDSRSEMVKRVCEAMDGAFSQSDTSWEKCARAAIAAMREPTKQMVLAGDTEKENCIDKNMASDGAGNIYWDVTIRSDAASTIYTRMIDEALK